MNEQINDLAEQCYHPYSEYHINLELFAELIIHECIEAVKNTDTTHAFTTYDKDTVDGTIIKCVQSIKERFKL